MENVASKPEKNLPGRGQLYSQGEGGVTGLVERRAPGRGPQPRAGKLAREGEKQTQEKRFIKMARPDRQPENRARKPGGGTGNVRIGRIKKT